MTRFFFCKFLWKVILNRVILIESVNKKKCLLGTPGRDFFSALVVSISSLRQTIHFSQQLIINQMDYDFDQDLYACSNKELLKIINGNETDDLEERLMMEENNGDKTRQIERQLQKKNLIYIFWLFSVG